MQRIRYKSIDIVIWGQSSVQKKPQKIQRKQQRKRNKLVKDFKKDRRKSDRNEGDKISMDVCWSLSGLFFFGMTTVSVLAIKIKY